MRVCDISEDNEFAFTLVLATLMTKKSRATFQVLGPLEGFCSCYHNKSFKSMEILHRTWHLSGLPTAEPIVVLLCVNLCKTKTSPRLYVVHWLGLCCDGVFERPTEMSIELRRDSDLSKRQGLAQDVSCLLSEPSSRFVYLLTFNVWIMVPVFER